MLNDDFSKEVIDRLARVETKVDEIIKCEDAFEKQVSEKLLDVATHYNKTFMDQGKELAEAQKNIALHSLELKIIGTVAVVLATGLVGIIFELAKGALHF